MSMLQQFDGFTDDGSEVTCIIDPEKSEAHVTLESLDQVIAFSFNPDFPQDAKDFFEALCTVLSIVTISKHPGKE